MGLQVSVARLRTSGFDRAGKMAYREIYIHSKLMLIDDVFVTIGSANMNQRSMAVDSEINIAASGQGHVRPLRERVFLQHFGENIGWAGSMSELPDVMGRWERRMRRNLTCMKKAEPMTGFLLPFEDHRSTTSMQG